MHNPGIYLSGINKMIKNNGYLLIGLPNIVNFNFLFKLMFFSKHKALKHSWDMLEKYNKVMHHINGWDPSHFITLLSSCGFSLVNYLPSEGTPISMSLKKFLLLVSIYILPFTTKLSYTMLFLVKKIKEISIKPNS